MDISHSLRIKGWWLTTPYNNYYEEKEESSQLSIRQSPYILIRFCL